MEVTIPPGEAELIRRSVLGVLSGDGIEALAKSARRISVEPGAFVIEQGTSGDDLFLLTEGQALILSGVEAEAVELAELSPGDVFGELSVLGETAVRTASVRAVSRLQCLVIPGERLRAALRREPDAAAALDELAQRLLIVRFLRETSAFAPLSDAARRELAGRIRRRTYEAGDPLIRAGDTDTSCLVIFSGSAEVLGSGGSDPIRIGPGTLVGEIAALTGEPRTATVLATERCVVLELGREDLVDAVLADRDVSSAVMDLLRLRQRPKRVDGIEAHPRTAADGEPYTILKDRARGVYFRLSALGWFVWERLDGTRNVRDLALAYFTERGGFAPEGIANIVAALEASGFVSSPRPPERVDAIGSAGGGRWRGLARRIRAILTWHTSLHNVDRVLTRLYGRVVRPIYTKAGQLVVAVVAVVGLAAFLLLLGDERSGWDPVWLLLLIPGFVISVFVHEAGHAFTAKAVGREVRQAGIGWFWIGPMAFVDTSDVWLASRRQRLAVALAGPYATIVFAGLCAIGALVWSTAAPALWVLASSSYISVVINLNPLLELDGYYTLVHLTDRPNLRPKALAWLATEASVALRHPSRIKGHRVEALYGLLSVAYLVAMAIIIVVVYRTVFQDWVSGFLPQALARVLAWVVAAGACLLLVAGVAGDLVVAQERSKKT